MPIPTRPHVLTDKRCGWCGSYLVVRWTIFSVFLGCIRYPKCEYVAEFLDPERVDPNFHHTQPIGYTLDPDDYEPMTTDYSLIDPNYD